MSEILLDRIKQEALYIVETKATVRACGKHFGVSKSSVHKDVTYRLKKADSALFSLVREVLDENKANRHIRGGEATKEKYLAAKNKQ